MSRRRPPVRTIVLFGALALLAATFVFVVLRSGPLAPVDVTVARVETRVLAPALFGVGTVQARHTYRVGPTAAGRVARVLVDVGDRVVEGQLIAEIDAIDLDDRIRAQDAVLRRSAATLAEMRSRRDYAAAEAERYTQLLAGGSTTEEIVAAKVQSRAVAEAAMSGASAELTRATAERDALRSQRLNLRLTAPAAGIITARDVEPGTTVVAGQTVLELIDPSALWVHVRFDQSNTAGLAAGQPAKVLLRSQQSHAMPGHVLRIEPRADAVTEELLAKVVFDAPPAPLPPIGELTEVTVTLPVHAAGPVIPNAAVHAVAGVTGVWRMDDTDPVFIPVTLGDADLDGAVQVRSGLKVGDRVVIHSAKPITARSRVTIVERLIGRAP
jgi:HlyD family secretion protein